MVEQPPLPKRPISIDQLDEILSDLQERIRELKARDEQQRLERRELYLRSDEIIRHCRSVLWPRSLPIDD
jgi:hypothetical protein